VSESFINHIIRACDSQKAFAGQGGAQGEILPCSLSIPRDRSNCCFAAFGISQPEPLTGRPVVPMLQMLSYPPAWNPSAWVGKLTWCVRMGFGCAWRLGRFLHLPLLCEGRCVPAVVVMCGLGFWLTTFCVSFLWPGVVESVESWFETSCFLSSN